MKKCMVCGEEKDLNEFPKKDKTTYRGKCKVCYYERKKELGNMSEEDKVLVREKNIEDRKKRLLEREEIKRVKKSKLCKICHGKILNGYDKNEKMMSHICNNHLDRSLINSTTNLDLVDIFFK